MIYYHENIRKDEKPKIFQIYLSDIFKKGQHSRILKLTNLSHQKATADLWDSRKL